MPFGTPEKRAVLWVSGRASSSPLGSCDRGLISQGWGTLPEAGLWWGGLPVPAWPCVLARNQPAAAQTKAISWGPPPCSSIRKGGPLYGWKNRGIFAMMGSGRRGLRVCSHAGLLLAPWPHVSEPHGGRGPLIAGCRCPVVVEDWLGILQATEGAWTLESPPG